MPSQLSNNVDVCGLWKTMPKHLLKGTSRNQDCVEGKAKLAGYK
jgi:hypothetical protein